ncbi:MAG: HAMP domain-containing sensor histidine kinase [Natrialbaceae archaeon]|nr:HAMP domain-containing sensor histidine kinase [Natrialbaceae archaeon]
MSRIGSVGPSRISTSSVRGTDGSAVGYTVTVKDVTRQQRRRQQLEVLNRVLRHNLRNDGTVIAGTADLIADIATELDAEPDTIEQIISHAETVASTTRSLTRTGEKARDIAKALPEEEIDRRTISLAELVESVDQSMAELDETVTITHSIPADATIDTDKALFGVVLENLVENAVLHGGTTVSIAATVTDDAIALKVADNGNGIPDHELEVLQAAGEDPLTHGSGMGLWIVAWGMAALGGEITFDVEDGTTVTLVHPTTSPTEQGVADHEQII